MIPFYSFQDIHSPEVTKQLIAQAEKIIRSGNYVFDTHAFEQEFAHWVDAEHCVAVSNGTAALHVALLALDIKPGDEVITVSHTFRATSSAVLYCGAVPRFVDIDPDTMVMDVSKVNDAITERTRAIIAVHLYGNAVDMTALKALSRARGLPVIEDCSQAHGTVYKGQHVGTMGDIGTFSFYPGKGLGALGDAGCTVTNRPELAQRMTELRSWSAEGAGFNYRMSNLQAEFLRIKLEDFDRVLAEKRRVADIYQAAFGPVAVTAGAEHSWHVYPVLVSDRDAFVQGLAGAVDTKSHYNRAVHQYSAFVSVDVLPVTEWVAAHQVSLPIYPSVDYVGVIQAVTPFKHLLTHHADAVSSKDNG